MIFEVMLKPVRLLCDALPQHLAVLGMFIAEWLVCDKKVARPVEQTQTDGVGLPPCMLGMTLGEGDPVFHHEDRFFRREEPEPLEVMEVVLPKLGRFFHWPVWGSLDMARLVDEGKQALLDRFGGVAVGGGRKPGHF